MKDFFWTECPALPRDAKADKLYSEVIRPVKNRKKGFDMWSYRLVDTLSKHNWNNEKKIAK